MTMRFYNTLTRSKEVFTPLAAPEVRLYACGPTVYHNAHIGNMRAYVFEDILRRALRLGGYKVKHVMNITDVGHLVSDGDEGEDKMEKGAAREGKSAWEIADFYTKAFFADFDSLNCERPEVICPATKHIPEMIALVRSLEDKGFAYRNSDGIYFDTAKFENYGQLAGKSHIEGLKAGARIEFSAEKRNPADFALWKFSPANGKRHMEWESPWGVGFPGWHIECSAMAMKHLGETLDIHCGGVDHVAVHHTNEIAQSEASTGKQFSRFWLHNEFLIMKGGAKMAKSAGEFVTVPVLRDKGYEPLDFRYLCLSAHYRTQLEFSWESMDFARKSLSTLRESVQSLVASSAGKTGKIPEEAKRYFTEALFDDLNTPKALAVVWETLRNAAVAAEDRMAFAEFADKILALGMFAASKQAELAPELMALIKAREEARKARDFKKADELRQELLAKGVEVKDAAAGVTRPKTKILKQD